MLAGKEFQHDCTCVTAILVDTTGIRAPWIWCKCIIRLRSLNTVLLLLLLCSAVDVVVDMLELEAPWIWCKCVVRLRSLNAVLLLTVLCSAVDVGVDMLELDCHLTKDGEVVVSHDDDLARITGQPVRISDTLFKVVVVLTRLRSLIFTVCTTNQRGCRHRYCQFLTSLSHNSKRAS